MNLTIDEKLSANENSLFIYFLFYFLTSHLPVWSPPGQRRYSSTAALHVFPDALWIHQSGVCPADVVENAQLETSIQILSLVSWGGGGESTIIS